jgi:hypothetical protein
MLLRIAPMATEPVSIKPDLKLMNCQTESMRSENGIADLLEKIYFMSAIF